MLGRWLRGLFERAAAESPVASQSISISDRTIAYNRPGTPLAPVGMVIHSTGNPGASAEFHYQYWNSANRESSVHLVVDWDQALALLPWQPGQAEVAWHAGSEANRRFLSMEICEATSADSFLRVWHNAVDVTGQVLRAYNWGPERLLSHAQVSWWWQETDHLDPLAYFGRWGRTWADFVTDVDRALRGLPATVPVAVLDAGGRKLVEGWLQDGKTVVPVRALAEGMGLDVEWQPDGPAVVLRWPGARA